MVKTLDAIFDGEVLRPEEPIPLEPNIRVRVTIETPETPPARARSFFGTARSLNLEGPSDRSARFEDYLYGRQTGASECG
ncbi:MAG: antitoxin family protein [Candidatus Latescibacteria bacterium]|nr:antitoxin family protein [Candidatus Latescibacterota bacterium]